MRRSKVIVTASIEVVPNRIDTATSPRSSGSTASTPAPERIRNIPVQASGKIRPQLTFGGLR
jgi:hypothetical protein